MNNKYSTNIHKIFDNRQTFPSKRLIKTAGGK